MTIHSGARRNPMDDVHQIGLYSGRISEANLARVQRRATRIDYGISY